MANAQDPLEAARIARNQQQAKYFEERVARLESSKNRPFKLMELIAVLGSLTAIVSVVLGFLSTNSSLKEIRRTRDDTAFFEALKRMGDQESAVVRAGAAPLLALKSDSDDYYTTVRSQLLSSMLLEQNQVVLEAIQDACRHLLDCHASDMKPRLKIIRDKVDNEVLEALAMLTLDADGNRPEVISDKQWKTIESLVPQTGFKRADYETLIGNRAVTFKSYQENAADCLQSLSPDEQTAARLQTRERFHIESTRLRLIEMLLE